MDFWSNEVVPTPPTAFLLLLMFILVLRLLPITLTFHYSITPLQHA